MPPRTLEFRVLTAQRVVIVTMSGVVTGADIAQTIPAIYTHADWQPGFNILWEGSLVTQLQIEREDLPGLVEVQLSFAGRAGRGRDVIVTDRVIGEMMGNMYMYVRLVQRVRPTSIATSVEEALPMLAHPDH